MNFGIIAVWSLLFVLLYFVNRFFDDNLFKFIGYIVSFIAAHYVVENVDRFWDKFKRK